MDLSKISSLITAELAGLKLILSLFVAYPISLVYQIFLTNSSVNLKCLYFILTGFTISYFNYGNNTIHLLITIFVVYCALKLNSRSVFINTFNFIFTLAYLLIGYLYTQTSVYAFSWTIPHCVLTLRLIAISFNLYDGNRCKSKNGKRCDHEDHLIEVPSFMEFFAHCLHPCSFLVGPQYEIHIFQKYVRRTDQVYSIVWKESIGKFIAGAIYLTIFMVGNQKVKPDYLTTDTFLNSSFLFKMTVIAIIAKVQIMKYIFVWLFTEGGLILSGITYDKKNDKKYELNNVDIVLYESTDKFNGLIKSFNIQTNNWTAKYIYKRLKFLGSKPLSHLMSLTFLSIWHGHKSGYYATFFMEFITVINEKESSSTFRKLQSEYPLFRRIVNSVVIEQMIYFILKMNIFYFLAYSYIPFLLLTHTKYLPILKSTYFALFVQAIMIFIVNKLIRFIFLKPSLSKKDN